MKHFKLLILSVLLITLVLLNFVSSKSLKDLVASKASGVSKVKIQIDPKKVGLKRKFSDSDDHDDEEEEEDEDEDHEDSNESNGSQEDDDSESNQSKSSEVKKSNPQKNKVDESKEDDDSESNQSKSSEVKKSSPQKNKVDESKEDDDVEKSHDKVELSTNAAKTQESKKVDEDKVVKNDLAVDDTKLDIKPCDKNMTDFKKGKKPKFPNGSTILNISEVNSTIQVALVDSNQTLSESRLVFTISGSNQSDVQQNNHSVEVTVNQVNSNITEATLVNVTQIENQSNASSCGCKSNKVHNIDTNNNASCLVNSLLAAILKGIKSSSPQASLNIYIVLAAKGGSVHLNIPEGNFSSSGNGYVKVETISGNWTEFNPKLVIVDTSVQANQTVEVVVDNKPEVDLQVSNSTVENASSVVEVNNQTTVVVPVLETVVSVEPINNQTVETEVVDQAAPVNETTPEPPANQTSSSEAPQNSTQEIQLVPTYKTSELTVDIPVGPVKIEVPADAPVSSVESVESVEEVKKPVEEFAPSQTERL